MNILQKLVEVTGGPSRCRLCFLTAKPEGLRLGRMWRYGDTVAHHQCLMLSSGILQNGEDDEGIHGFLSDDIDTEVRRGQHLKCSLCKKNNATIGCCVRSCKKTFHLPCLQLSGGLSQFFGSFDSYCNEHKPKQRVPGLTWKTKTTGKGSKITKKRYYGTAPCGVCLDMVSKKPSVNILWTPCCCGWFHRNCIEYMAETAGSTFFKCPLCNNKEVFEREMQKFGIYIPIEDAKWETEPRAYEDLYKRHSRCDEKRCLCPNGRSTNQEDTDWEIVLCEMCGSSGVHVACGQLDPVFLRWKCETCSGVIYTPQKVPKAVKLSKWLVDSDSDDNGSGSQGEESDEPSALEGCSSSSVGHVIKNASDGPSIDRSRSSSSSTRGTRKQKVQDVTANSRQKGRCGECPGCNRDNCGECKFCLDMKKFGGPNKLRQACLMRKCNPEIELDNGDYDDPEIELDNGDHEDPEIELNNGDHDCVNIEDESTNNGDSQDEKNSGPPNLSKMGSLDGSVRNCIWNWNCKIDLKVTSQVGGAQNCFTEPDNVKKEGLWNWECRVDVERLENWKDFVVPRKSDFSSPPPEVQSDLKCQKCDFLSDSVDLLKRHQKLHDPSRQFVCSICQLRFIKERHVRIHERIHTGEKPHKCDICGECFAEAWSLRIHMSKHNSRRKFVCKFCKWRFKSSSALMVHEEKHFKAPSSTSNSFRQASSTITSSPSSFLSNFKEPIQVLPSSSSEGRLSRRDSQSSKRSAERCVERSPSNCSASSLPDIMERSASASPTDMLEARMSPFLEGLELAHVSTSPASGTSRLTRARFQNPLDHLHPLETELSSLVKMEDGGLIEPTTQTTHDVSSLSRTTTSVVVPRITRNIGTVPGEDYIVPVFSRIVTRTKSGIRSRESFTKYASPSRSSKTDNESVKDHMENNGDDIVVLDDFKDSGDVNPIVTRTKSGIRPRESFTKYGPNRSSKTDNDKVSAMQSEDLASLPVGTEVSAKYKGAFCEAKVKKVARQVKCKVTFIQGLGSFTLSDESIKCWGQPLVGANVEAKHPDNDKYFEAVINKIQDQSQYTVVFDDGDITTLRRNALCMKSGKHFSASESLDKDHMENNGDDIKVFDDFKDSGDVNPIGSSTASSRSSSCSKKSRMVNQLSDFLGRGLREVKVTSRICRRTEKRRKLGIVKNNGTEILVKKSEKVDLKKCTKKGYKKGFFKKKKTKKIYEGVVMFADDCNVSMMYDIEDLNLETQVEEFGGDTEDFDEDPYDHIDPICIDPLIDVHEDSFIVADEIILEGSAVIEAINNQPELDPLEQSDEVQLKVEPAVTSNTNEQDPENAMTKEESLEITPMDLKSELPVDASGDNFSEASIGELSDEILCSEPGREDTSAASLISNHEHVPDLDVDLISASPQEESNLGSVTKNVTVDLIRIDTSTGSKVNGEPDKITDELDERQAMILRMSSCELAGEPGTSRQGSSLVQGSGDPGSSLQEKTEDNDMDFEEEPLVNFLELCED